MRPRKKQRPRKVMGMSESGSVLLASLSVEKIEFVMYIMKIV